jgi:hypothetical protein
MLIDKSDEHPEKAESSTDERREPDAKVTVERD